MPDLRAITPTPAPTAPRLCDVPGCTEPATRICTASDGIGKNWSKRCAGHATPHSEPWPSEPREKTPQVATPPRESAPVSAAGTTAGASAAGEKAGATVSETATVPPAPELPEAWDSALPPAPIGYLGPWDRVPGLPEHIANVIGCGGQETTATQLVAVRKGRDLWPGNRLYAQPDVERMRDTVAANAQSTIDRLTAEVERLNTSQRDARLDNYASARDEVARVTKERDEARAELSEWQESTRLAMASAEHERDDLREQVTDALADVARLTSELTAARAREGVEREPCSARTSSRASIQSTHPPRVKAEPAPEPIDGAWFVVSHGQRDEAAFRDQTDAQCWAQNSYDGKGCAIRLCQPPRVKAAEVLAWGAYDCPAPADHPRRGQGAPMRDWADSVAEFTDHRAPVLRAAADAFENGHGHDSINHAAYTLKSAYDAGHRDAAPQWIAATERLPDRLYEVLVAINHKGVRRYAFLADWNGSGKAAGVLRNGHMVADAVKAAIGGHVVECIAFPGGKGTADCVRRIKAANLPLVEVT